MNGTWQDDFKALMPARVPAWLGPLRQAGMSRFAESGFPGSRDEEWRFTPITPYWLHEASSPSRQYSQRPQL